MVQDDGTLVAHGPWRVVGVALLGSLSSHCDAAQGYELGMDPGMALPRDAVPPRVVPVAEASPNARSGA